MARYKHLLNIAEFVSFLAAFAITSLLTLLILALVEKLLLLSNSTTYKIKSKFFTLFCVRIYCLIFVFWVLIIRYKTWGITFDLYSVLIKFAQFNFRLQIILLALMILITLILLYLRLFLKKEIIKAYIYYYGSPYYGSTTHEPHTRRARAHRWANKWLRAFPCMKLLYSFYLYACQQAI